MAEKKLEIVGYTWGPRSSSKYGVVVIVDVRKSPAGVLSDANFNSYDPSKNRVELEFDNNGYVMYENVSYSALEVVDSDNKTVSELIKKDIDSNQNLRSLYYGWGLFPENRPATSGTNTVQLGNDSSSGTSGNMTGNVGSNSALNNGTNNNISSGNSSVSTMSGDRKFIPILYSESEFETTDKPVFNIENVVRHTEISYRTVSNAEWNEPSVNGETGDSYYSYMKFGEILEYIRDNNFDKLPIGQLMGKITDKLLETPYVGGTLEIQPEKPSCNLSGLDCVTFFESTLGIARAIKNYSYTSGLNPDSVFPKVISEISLTRYRDGNPGDYTTRLHYTSEWIIDNTKKGVIQDLTKSLGGVKFNLNLNFMSTHPNSYPALKQNRSFVSTIKSIEQSLNAISTHSYIPKANIRNIENKLQTGDIIAIATTNSGLDYSHTGMIYKNQNGQSLFMHASSLKQKVVRDVAISFFVDQMSSNLGIAVLRPL